LLKENENPPIAYPDDTPVTEFPGSWWVAHTKSRNEKALAQDLIARDIRYFLPMTLSVSRRTHRTVKSMLPLFTGYLFFSGTEEQRIEVLRTHRVANIIDVADQGAFVREIAQIDQALRLGAPLCTHQYIKKGQWCRVIAGPLLGLEGIVQEVRGATRLILQIEILGQAASVEIDMDMIEQIDPPVHHSEMKGSL